MQWIPINVELIPVNTINFSTQLIFIELRQYLEKNVFVVLEKKKA